MRVFGLLGLIVVLAILLFQYRSNVLSVGKQQQQEQSSTLSKSVEDDVNNSVSVFQKKLDDAMKQTNE